MMISPFSTLALVKCSTSQVSIVINLELVLRSWSPVYDTHTQIYNQFSQLLYYCQDVSYNCLASKLFKQRALSQRNSRQSTLKWNFRRFRIKISYQLKAVVQFQSDLCLTITRREWDSKHCTDPLQLSAWYIVTQYCIITRQHTTSATF